MPRNQTNKYNKQLQCGIQIKLYLGSIRAWDFFLALHKIIFLELALKQCFKTCQSWVQQKPRRKNSCETITNWYLVLEMNFALGTESVAVKSFCLGFLALEQEVRQQEMKLVKILFTYALSAKAVEPVTVRAFRMARSSPF